MPSDPVLDLPALLAPIPGENPAGAFVKTYAPEFVALLELLPKADKAVAESIEEKTKPGDWPTLLKKSTDLIKTKTKDLRIAERLVQAAIHKHGFPGLRDGLKLLEGLLTDFWDGLYPLPEDGDIEARLNPLIHFCSESEAPVWVRDIPIASAPAVSNENDNIKVPATLNLHNLIYEAKSDKAAQFKTSLSTVIVKTPPEFYQQMAADILDARDAADSFNSCGNEKFGVKQAPDVSKLRESLDACYSRIATICKDRNIPLQAVAASSHDDDSTVGNSVQTGARTGSNGHAGPISNRAEALAKLREIADFLKRAEPHSPVSYLINRAIAWSEMPFEKLLLELVTDPNSLQSINTTLGIKATEDGGGGYGSYNSGGYGEGGEPPSG